MYSIGRQREISVCVCALLYDCNYLYLPFCHVYTTLRWDILSLLCIIQRYIRYHYVWNISTLMKTWCISIPKFSLTLFFFLFTCAMNKSFLNTYTVFSCDPTAKRKRNVQHDVFATKLENTNCINQPTCLDYFYAL